MAELTAEELRAQAMLRFHERKRRADEAWRNSAGAWGHVPKEYATGWHFVRLGIRGDAMAEHLAAEFRDMGWVDAPPGVVYLRTMQADQGRALVLMCPKEMKEELNAERDRKQQEALAAAKRGFKAIAQTMRGVYGGGVEVIETKEEHVQERMIDMNASNKRKRG